MRVVAGDLRGRNIPSHRCLSSVRLTASHLKEAVFSRLGADLTGLNFLDLCAGSGQIGLEAYSRGAQLTINEPDRRRHEQIQQLIRSWRLEEVCLLSAKAQTLLPQLESRRQRFDLVYLDPPYHATHGGVPLSCFLLEQLGALELLPQAAGLGLVQHQKELSLPAASGSLERIDQRTYGNTSLSTYRRAAAADSGPCR
jgi:16S rRNA (guanine966-N2)-methyltransferase